MSKQDGRARRIAGASDRRPAGGSLRRSGECPRPGSREPARSGRCAAIPRRPAPQQGRSDEGIAIIRNSLAVAPANAGAWNNLGNVLLSTGRIDDAVEAYEQCVAMAATHPAAIDALSNLGVVSREQSRLADSESACRLEEAFAAARRRLRPGGCFVFTVEALGDDDTRPHALIAIGRYAHRVVRRRGDRQRRSVARSAAQEMLRVEAGLPVVGCVVVERSP